MNRSGIRPALLPLIVAALVVPIAVAAMVGGAGFAVFVAALVLLGMVILAVRAKPRVPIEVEGERGRGRRILLAISEPVEGREAADDISRAARVDGGSDTEILALAPTQPGFLDRWASDVREARSEAERKLAITVSSLPKRLEPRTEIGESDLVVAVEDSLRGFAADEVILATGPADDDHAGWRAARELRDRLPVPFEHLVVGNGETAAGETGR